MKSIRYQSSRTGSKVDQREDFHTMKSPPTGYVTHISNPTHIPEIQKKFLEISMYRADSNIYKNVTLHRTKISVSVSVIVRNYRIVHFADVPQYIIISQITNTLY